MALDEEKTVEIVAASAEPDVIREQARLSDLLEEHGVRKVHLTKLRRNIL